MIIGANFGDEGKGLITDYRAASYGEDAIVVRYNGGPQAGHTVVAPDGRRHVFSHFGCGSFAGAATFLSRYFASNPLLFAREYESLAGLGVTPRVFIDRDAPVTTPYDMMINQIVEDARGTGRHGSCGVGFGETIERSSVASHAIFHRDLLDRTALTAKFETIRRDWVPQRLYTLGVSSIPDDWSARLYSRGVENKFYQDIEFQLEHSTMVSGDFLAGIRHGIVFEGAQGLLLDQDHAWFPHVTRSHTGLRNVMELARASRLDHLNVTYATRAYMTRHGNGPMPYELSDKPYDGIRDDTNVPHAYQGALRFGWLDFDLLKATIENDLPVGGASLTMTRGLAVTCLDQLDDVVTYVQDGELRTVSRDNFARALEQRLQPGFLLASRGPSRLDVTAETEWLPAAKRAGTARR